MGVNDGLLLDFVGLHGRRLQGKEERGNELGPAMHQSVAHTLQHHEGADGRLGNHGVVDQGLAD